MRGQHSNRIYCEQRICNGRIGRDAESKKERDTTGTVEDYRRSRGENTSACCGAPPAGRVRWTLRLLEKAVELGIAEVISDNTIGRLLKKRRLSLTGISVGVFRRSITASV